MNVTAGAYLFGAIGAAYGVVVSEAISVLLMKRALQKVIPLRSPEKILRIVPAVIIMAVCVATVIPYGFVWGILLGAACYSFMLILLRAVLWNDVKTLIARF